MIAPQTNDKWMKPIAPAVSPELIAERMTALLPDGVALKTDQQALGGQISYVIPAQHIHQVLRRRVMMKPYNYIFLVDITAVDYLSYPNWFDERFAVIYELRSLVGKHRLRFKVFLEEDEAEIDSVHELYGNANWLERETYDQYGIDFIGHPNLKRLLNHHEFQGHPLRKDYPAQKRQHLSINDPMIDELADVSEPWF